MARIRTVKPEFFRHEGLFEADAESGLPCRLAFVGLFCCADRDGRFRWRPRELKLDVLPYDDIDFSRVLDALLTRGFLAKYTTDNVEYGCIPTWTKHQFINNRESAGVFPAPPKTLVESTTPTRDPRVIDASGTRLEYAQVEGEGEGEGERKGKGKVASPTRQVFAYWQRILNKPNSKLTKDRQAKIEARFKDGYTVDDMERAIDGCARSAHHMGQNDRNTVYDDLELICRDGKHLENFRDNIGVENPNKLTQGLIDWYNESEERDRG